MHAWQQERARSIPDRPHRVEPPLPHTHFYLSYSIIYVPSGLFVKCVCINTSAVALCLTQTHTRIHKHTNTCQCRDESDGMFERNISHSIIIFFILHAYSTWRATRYHTKRYRSEQIVFENAQNAEITSSAESSNISCSPFAKRVCNAFCNCCSATTRCESAKWHSSLFDVCLRMAKTQF